MRRGPAKRALLTVLIIGASLLASSCNRGDEPAAPASKPAAAGGTGVVSGVVKFDGTPPPPAPLGDKECCGKPTPVTDESLVVDAAGGVRNVVVYLEDGPNVPTSPAQAVLDQQGCRYVPHVVAVRTGQALQVRSSDPTVHNAHADKGANRPFNFAFTDAGQTKEVTFAKPDVAFRVRCDVHQWMSAFVAVFDHPFFAVTGDGGAFELTGVPPGTYTLVAWHERYGKKSQQVTVGEGTQAAAAPAEFRFGK